MNDIKNELKKTYSHCFYIQVSFDSNLSRTQLKNWVTYISHWDHVIKQKLTVEWITVLDGEDGYVFQDDQQRGMLQCNAGILTTDTGAGFQELLFG